MSRRGRIVLTAILFALGGTASVHAAPLVFDFEDGPQGWELHGSAQRVQTQVLAGQWAIFGDGLAEGGASLSIDIDLTGIASISVDQFFAGDATSGTDFLFLLTFALDQPPDAPRGFGQSVTGSSGPGSNRSSRVIPLDREVLPFEGVHRVSFGWTTADGSFNLGPRPPNDLALGLIDNITFHPIPEPGHLGLLGLVGVGALRRLRLRR